jgi:pimeloyl-ACP methyl ester carboxylesterase
MDRSPYPPEWLQEQQWRGLRLSLLSAPATSSGPGTGLTSSTVVLIHGFGACKEHWRHNVEPLRAERPVLAIDLIGFGASAKPRSRLEGEPAEAGSVRYGIDLWAEQVVDVLSACGVGPVQLVGNSIGGVVALAAAERLAAAGRPARQVVLLDCAQRALDDKRLAEQPPLARWGRPLLKSLVRQRWLTGALFRSLARPAVIRRVLLQAYPSGAHVDDQLVALLLKPALQPGASEAFRGFINLFNDRIAPELLAELTTPVTMVWGQQDPWEPVAEARRWAASFACLRKLHELPGLGHCPHDEGPEQLNPLLLEILRQGDQRDWAIT